MAKLTRNSTTETMRKPITPKSPEIPAARPKRSTSGITDEQIRARAYEVYLARRGGPGSPESDWAQAETELLGHVTRW